MGHWKAGRRGCCRGKRLPQALGALDAGCNGRVLRGACSSFQCGRPPGLCTLPFSLQPTSPALWATRSFLTQASWAQLYFPDPMRVTRKPRTPVGLPLSQHPTLRAPSEGNWRTSHHRLHCYPGPLQGSRLAAVISSLGTPCTRGGPLPTTGPGVQARPQNPSPLEAWSLWALQTIPSRGSTRPRSGSGSGWTLKHFVFPSFYPSSQLVEFPATHNQKHLPCFQVDLLDHTVIPRLTF